MAKQDLNFDKLSKDERGAKSFIDVAFKPHDGTWMQTAKRLKDFYQGKYFSATENKDRFIVNTIFSLVNLMLPSLVFNAPYVQVKPREPKYYKELADGEYQELDNNKAAMVREVAINNIYDVINGLSEHRNAIQDSFYYGFGVTKVGYSYETLTENDQEYVVKDTPFIKRVNPKDFGWHPFATGIHDSEAFVHRTTSTKARLKKIKRFKNVDKLKPEVPVFLKERFKNSEWVKGSDVVSLYEVHDYEKDKIYTFGGEEKILLAKDELSSLYKFDGPHFNLIKFASDADMFEGIPLLSSVEDECIALNEILTLIVEHYRKFPGAVFFEKGSIDEDDILKMRNGEQGSLHGVNSIEKIKFQNPLSMGQEYFQIVQTMQGLTDRILGIPDFQRLTSTTRKSATEATIVQGDVTVRRQYLLQLVKEFMLRDIEKLASLQAQFQTGKEMVQATGELGGAWLEYDKRDLQGKWRFDFDLDTLQVSNEARLQALTTALGILGSNEALHPILRTLDPDKTAKLIFKSLGMNIDMVRANTTEYTVFIDPKKENEMARKGEPMPAPKKGEDYEYHRQTHLDDLKANGWNEQIADHIAATIMLEEQEKNVSAGGGTLPPQPAAPQPGPMGPMQTDVPVA